MGAGWSNPPPLQVPQRLRPHVRAIYGYAAAGMTPGVHRGLPSDTLTLVLAIGDPLRTAVSWEHLRAGEVDAQHVVLGGLHTTSAVVLQPQCWAGVQVAVSPLGARALFGAPAAALPTGRWDARDLLGAPADQVSERLAEAVDWPARYAVVVDFFDDLISLSDPGRVPRPEVREAWRVVVARAGRISVGAVARHVGLSPRRLSTLFAAELGLTPKVAARLVRFDTARVSVAATAVARGPLGGSLDLSRLAAELGFYDHAHLVREFRAFAGLSPSAWIGEEFRNVQAGAELQQAASSP